MKQLLLTGAFMLSTLVSFSQLDQWCGTDAHNASIFAQNPDLETQMHEHLKRVAAGAYLPEVRDGDCIIPVVVHILHAGGEGNISNEQVLSGIQMLNEDFNRDNDDADATRDTEEAPFLDIASNMGIRFELAKIDPDGNCTNGIQRRNVGSRSYNCSNTSKNFNTGGLSAWNRNYYFNIWIVNSIASGGAGTILGYAEFPYGGGSSTYGVIIRNDAYGFGGTASGDRTLTHEVGHCLGLLHTFQGGCHAGSCNENGDYCCDTPPVSEAQWSCVTTQNTCDEIPGDDPYGFDAFDQFENFMSYSPCQNMYSEDQKNIVISNLESIGFLANLVDPDNHSETGVGVPAVLCKAQFMSTDPTVCAGNMVQFNDDSYANVTGWNWTFEGGSPASSNEENPIVTYDTPGVYNVTLEVTDGASTVSSTSESYVTVLQSPGINLPYSEGFESFSELPNVERFLILDEDEEDAWEINDEVSYSGTQCAWIKNRGNDNRTLDELISVPIDLSGVYPDDNIVLNFKYAYKRRNASTDEWLRFYVSNDCGETWALRKNLHGDDLGEEIQSSSYTPESQDEWTQVNITNINAAYYSADFRFKFQFENDNGNNIYLDDINMYTASMVNIEENETQPFGLNIYPNPTSDFLNVQLTLTEQSEINIVVLNALGQEILTVLTGAAATGLNEYVFDTLNVLVGVSFILTVTNNGME